MAARAPARLVAGIVLAGVLAGAAAAPGDPQCRHAAADDAIAKRVLLVRADLGKGWTAKPGAAGPTSLTCASFHPDQADLVETGAAATPSYLGSTTGPFVAQSAWVYKTDKQAEALWRRVVGPGLLRCLVETVQAGSTKDVTFTVTRKGELKVPRLAQRIAGFRVISNAKSAGQSVTTYYDMLVLASGRTVTQVSFAEFGKPIPSAVEVALSKAIAKRLGSSAAA